MKNQTNAAQAENPLGTAPVGSLITKFAIPAIISMLVSALYNIVDQIFIGQGVGMLGNAATNIAFPVTIISTAAALLLGIGSASNYNLEMGAGNEKKSQLHCRNRTLHADNLRYDTLCHCPSVPEATSSFFRRNTGRHALCH